MALLPQWALRAASGEPAAQRPGAHRCVRTFIVVSAMFLVGMFTGCRDAAVSEPDAKIRLKKLLALYQAYVEHHKKGPPNEQALREFGKKLTPAERDAYLIGDDLENIFSSPRDNQRFVVHYSAKPDVAESRAVAWEAVGAGGMRFVALSNGYVEEYDEETFRQYKP